MRICFLTNTLNIDSGGGRYSWNIISRALDREGVEGVVLTEKNTGSNMPFEKPILENVFGNFPAVFINAFRARKYVKQCDIVHCFDGYPYGIIGVLANIGLNKKIIINAVGTYSVAPLEQRIKKSFLKWAYKKADYIPCISLFVEQEILKRVQLNNTLVANLGVDFDKFQGNVPDAGNKKQKIILGVGALKPRKGYHISIPAVSLIKQKYPDFKYYIIGHQDNQNYFNQLKGLADKYGIKENVIFLEKISDEKLVDFYHRCDLFLLTPINNGLHFEGFGLVYLEANACGKPVVGVYGCGVEDAVKNGYNGLLVPQNDIKAIAKAVLRILDDENLYKELSNNAREWAKAMDWSKMAEKYIELYFPKGHGKSVRLDIGCGKNKKQGFIGIDIDKKSKADIIASAFKLPFGNDSVDEIYSAHLVEHFSPREAEKFFAEVYRVLRKGAGAFLKIDHDWTRKRLLTKDKTHKYRYSTREIKRILKKLNFSRSEVKRKIYLSGCSLKNKIFVRLVK